MKSLSKNISAAILLLSIAITTTLAISCNKKDPCVECAEKNIELNNNTDTVVIKNNPSFKNSNRRPSGVSAQNTTLESNRESKLNQKNEPNVSIIDPNQKSNTDTDRVYGSSGTSGGSGTSGSGGEGNGSTGWNDNVKKK
ncbi:hypothetical protein GV828_02770 [Flavobacterium sp. NST-5]|uniref:Lipoprotein n=1 Tax=Flavobacterium ichthyis TaxID=2698827 RepID=A0ABW9Z611_9FLAO|nr:hypothetical protein [Flavobacterium ichthyis]NBL64119.1 hypothetical protein [Flavobacterium ichthyis]